jgi:DNA invertase Pin-like site-specific DNA recombinase
MSARQQEAPIRAVEYVRMSTEQQHFSIDAQRKLIGEYAHEHGYNIVRSYSDPGQSGLSLRGRRALQALLSDALNPERDFSTILIRDISRWGRFQDPDQAAHYEFICRQAGVQIVYCAEPFISDTTPVSTIVKHLKRVMASEYSRDLSDKMSRAHLYHAGLGFKQGGVPVYGFRRLLVDECNTPKYILQPGETKTLIGERVRIVPGSFDEQEVIRSIFELYVDREWSLIEIAMFLKNQGIAGNLGKPWTFRMVRNILTCELCIGCYTYNKTTQKLQTPPRKIPKRSGYVRPIYAHQSYRKTYFLKPSSAF